MQIKVAERLKPFSHTPGVFCLLPGTSLRMQIFPTLIRIHDLSGVHPVPVDEFILGLKGPVQEFTVQQDLEAACLRFWGHYREGYFCFRFYGVEEERSFAWKCERGPKEGFQILNKSLKVLPKETLIPAHRFPSGSRLSLGSHKMQDWDLMQRRSDLKEILPIWLRLGQLTPEQPSCPKQGTLALLEECRERIESQDRLRIEEAFLSLFKAAFEGMLSPCLEDTQHQGYEIPALHEDFKGSPLLLLKEGAKLIRELFISVDQRAISFLQALPVEFHSGRFVNVDCGSIGTLHMEWSKKTIRRIILHAGSSRELELSFSKRLKRFRLRRGVKDRGVLINTGSPLSIENEQTYFLDNFQS